MTTIAYAPTIETQISLERHSFAMAQSRRKEQVTRMSKESGESMDFGKMMMVEINQALIQYLSELSNDSMAIRKAFYKDVIKNLDQEQIELFLFAFSRATVSNIITQPALNKTINNVYSSVMRTLGFSFDETNELAKKYKPFILGALIRISEITDIFIYQTKVNQTNTIALTPQWLDVVDKNIQEAQVFTDSYVPMIIEPFDHVDLISGSGGYVTFQSPLLKHPTKVNGSVHPAIRNFNSSTQPEFFKTINKQQKTPYCVNKDLLDVILRCYEKGMEWKDFPMDVANELHQLAIHEEVQKTLTTYAKNEWELYDNSVEFFTKQETTKVRNLSMKTKSIFDTMSFYSGFDKIYFPLFLDSRSRRYTYTSDIISYLGNTLTKPLIQLANKDEVDENGKEMFFLALGNALGVDKYSLAYKAEKAKAWYADNIDSIKADDWSVFFNSDLDEPANAMAIVIELMKLEQDPSYKSGFIFHVDARCSGVSLIGSMLRDKRVMTLTSVLDVVKDGEACKLPDAYMTVANQGKEIATKLKLSSLLVKDVLFSRSTWKKPVMTLGYAATEAGRRKTNRDLFADDKTLRDLNDEDFADFQNVMESALKEALPSCMSYLDTCRKAAKTAAKRDNFIYFNSPLTGFPCVYTAFKEKKAEIVVKNEYNQKVKLIEYVKTDKISHQDMVQWTVPSVVHATDAAILHKITEKVDFDIATIHDSFGSSVKNVQKLVKIYAELVQELASSNALDSIYAQFDETVEVPYINTATPEDIETIVDSKHILA